jgi:response regulator RpfG family c-di-GMP phosphodiesterase
MMSELKILYVDDELINLLIFEKIMGRKYTVVTALSGQKGLETLQKDPNIKFVISDMRMPAMSGLEFIKKAKELYTDKYYFILTGYSINEEIQQALDTNLIVNYFTKPANFELIDKTLKFFDPSIV